MVPGKRQADARVEGLLLDMGEDQRLPAMEPLTVAVERAARREGPSGVVILDQCQCDLSQMAGRTQAINCLMAVSQQWLRGGDQPGRLVGQADDSDPRDEQEHN